MANVPLAFLNEEVSEHLAHVYRQRERAQAVARRIAASTNTVAANWNAIQEHKWLLSERVGRDVGMEVAALDYFDNIDKSSNNVRLNWFRRAWERVLESLDGDGPRSIANLERWMGATR